MYSLRLSHVAMMALGLMLTQPALATETTDDGFGSSFFSAEAPTALQDGASDTDFWAEQLSVIEPAAGGEDPFLLPPTSTQNATDRLDTPTQPIVPGMASDNDHPVLP